MRIVEEVKLDFDDVLFIPKRSNAPSRSNIDLEKSYTFRNSGNKWSGVPIIAANMDGVGTFSMFDSLSEFNLCTALHKHYDEDELVHFFMQQKYSDSFAFYTLGIKDEDLEKLKNISDRMGHPRNLCVDVANGYTKYFVDKVKKIRDLYPHANIMAGNVATPEMVQELLLSGAADIIKIGIGPGSVCTTRSITGVGYPQLSAIIECADVAHGLGGHICADGGCKEPGDIAKAFGANADFVMLGGMLSGHIESELDIHSDIKNCWIEFYGMSSNKAQEIHDGCLKDYRASEGKVVKIPFRGEVKDTIREILGGLRSTCSLVGAPSLKDLPKCTTFVRVNRIRNHVFDNKVVGI